MATIGLSLSGGGFRASLFHLGVLKRLDELGILDKVTHISAVSGGAVTASLYVDLKRQQGGTFRFADVERSLINGVKTNPRTRWLLVTFVRRIFTWFLPPRIRIPLQRAFGGTLTFESFFRNQFFGDIRLDQFAVPAASQLPRLILNTTSLEIGQDFFFTPTYIGPREEAAMGITPGPTRIAPQTITLARAVSASACFPLVFPPYVLQTTPNSDDDNQARTGMTIERTNLVDGGVYDNQGFRVFLTEANVPRERVDYLIASDASKTLTPSDTPLPPWYNPLKRLDLLLRAHNITEDRARWERFGLLLYKLRTGDLKQSAFFHTSTTVIPATPYRLPAQLTGPLTRLRTDFDSFSDLEIATLAYHGYTVADYTITYHCPDLVPPGVLIGGPPAWWSGRPLQSWPDFVRQIQASTPPRNSVRNWLVNWLEKPWRPFLAEANPTNPRNPAARDAAMAHLTRGGTGSLVWRGLQRLGDRGGWGWVWAVIGKGVVMGLLLYLLREVLIVAVDLVSWIIDLTTGIVGGAGWLEKLFKAAGSLFRSTD